MNLTIKHFDLSIDRSNIVPLHLLQAPDRRQSLAIGKLENNFCHVVNTYEMLASDVCYRERVCVGPMLGRVSMWAHPLQGM